MLNKAKTKKNQFFNKFYRATRCALLCAVLCSVVNFVVQFCLRENKFHIVTYCKHVVISTILWSYLHFRIFAFTFIYFLPCLLKNQWNVDQDNTYMKMERKIFWKKGQIM